MKGHCNVCGDECTTKCSKCPSVFYCSREHQHKDWKNHKLTCVGSPSPPHEPTLLARVEEADFEYDDFNIMYSDEAYDLLDTLCQQIYKNAVWCTYKNMSLTVLLDATRALMAIHKKSPTPRGGNGNIPDQLWRCFDADECWGSGAWTMVVESWEKALETNGKHINASIASELFAFYNEFEDLGWDELEPITRRDDWPGMVEARKSAPNIRMERWMQRVAARG